MTRRRSSRWRSESRSFSADNWSVTSVWVASQPPFGIGRLTSVMTRPSLISIGLGFRAPLGHLLEAIGDIASGSPEKVPGGSALDQQVAQRRARPRVLGPQTVHLKVALVAQHQPCRAVEHAQALRHVVECGAQQAALRAAAAVGKQAGHGRSAKRERQRHDDASDRCGRFRQHADDPARPKSQISGDAAAKPMAPAMTTRPQLRLAFAKVLPTSITVRQK